MSEAVTAEEECEAAALLADLVAIPSVNPRDEPAEARPYGEERIANFVAECAAGFGAEVEMEQVLPGRPNVYGVLGNAADVRLILETHLDTVAADKESELLRPRVEEHRLYGRGACDAKASLAAMLLACQGARRRLQGGLLLAAVVDEEHQFLGVQALLRRKPQARLVVVGEPTDLRPVVATKGCVRFQVTVRGKAAHTAAPEAGINAVVQACRVITALEEQLAPTLSARQHRLVGPPTLAVTRIRGGTEVNVAPAECSFHVDRRIIPGETPQEALGQIMCLLEELRAREPELDVTLGAPYLVDPPLDQSPGQPAVQSFLRVCQRVLGEASPSGVAFSTDASKFAQAGLPALVFGPGNIAQAHAADEWVDVRQVALAARVYAEAAVAL